MTTISAISDSFKNLVISKIIIFVVMWHNIIYSFTCAISKKSKSGDWDKIVQNFLQDKLQLSGYIKQEYNFCIGSENCSKSI